MKGLEIILDGKYQALNSGLQYEGAVGALSGALGVGRLWRLGLVSRH